MPPLTSHRLVAARATARAWHEAGAFPRHHERHHQIVVAAGGRSVLDQPGLERFGRVRQQLMDEGVIAQQCNLVALKRQDQPVEPLPLAHRRGGKRMHRHGEIAPELFSERIPYGVALGDNRPDTEPGAEGLDACNLPGIVELHEPIERDNRLRLGGEIEEDACGCFLELPPVDA